MATIQAEIAQVCRNMESDKATERKKNADNLKLLLRDTEILKLLDANSDGRKRNVISWDFILKATQTYVRRELEVLLVQKPRNSQSTSSNVANNREKKRQEVMLLLKLIIKTADERDKYRLNGKELVHYVITMLKTQDKAVTGDYLQILGKHILTSRTYCCELTSEMWKDLIILVSGIINSPTSERSLSTKTFSQIISSAVTQLDMSSNRLFKFFTNAFTDIRNETNTQVLEYLLSSLLTFSKAVIVDCRGQLCQLGEDLLPPLLQIWGKPYISVKKPLLVKLINVVILVHPRVEELKAGALCVDYGPWRQLLQKIYLTICADLKQESLRIKQSPLTGLTEAVIELSANVLHQLFWFHSKKSPVPVVSGPGSFKRRKVEVGWNVLRDTLTNSPETSALLGWLQITAKLLSKYPNCLPDGEYLSLLTSLHQLQIERKKQEIISGVMECLQHLSACCVKLLEPRPSVEEISVKTTWRNVWLAALRTCSSPGLQNASFQLLESIIQTKLVDADTEPWKLLTDVGCSSSECSLLFLWRYLVTLPLPERFHYTNQASELSHYPLRHQLFEWLLPSVSKIEQQGYSVEGHYSRILSRLPLGLLSRVLVMLTQRVCHTTSGLAHILDFERKCVGKFAEGFKEVENIYLLSSFNKRTETNLVDPLTLVEESTTDNNTVKELLSFLVQRMVEISEKLTENLDGESSVLSSPHGSTQAAEKRHELLPRFSCLSTKVLGLFLYINAFNFNELTECPLYRATKKVLNAVSSRMAESLGQKDDLKGKAVLGASFIATLNDLFLCGPSTNQFNRDILEVVRSMTPTEMIESMMQIITREPVQPNKTHMVLDEFDGTFIDNEEASDGFEVNNSIPKPAFQPPMADQKMNSENLSENEKSKVSYMKIVCSWCTCVDKSHDLQDNVRNRIFEYFESTDFDILKPFHSKLFFAASFILCSAPIKGKHVLVVLHHLRTFISKHRKDQEYCKEGLSLLTLLATQFGRSEVRDEADMKDAQARSLHLLKAFCTSSNCQVYGYVHSF
ncbi:serine-protein kinase ATM-like [Dendronephthya gigantea]|uniref:serine-protein kinase ATM-like n=1 Tax=Dendronephthya gigantea TaxID=151771 RepID=UPI00106BE77E|nr:serine-protein kinase ATM-like [Dendronephthya gigantea]